MEHGATVHESDSQGRTTDPELLNAGAPARPTRRDKRGRTALHQRVVDAVDHEGMSPMMLAAERRQADIVRHLARLGARTNRVAANCRSFDRAILNALRNQT